MANEAGLVARWRTMMAAIADSGLHRSDLAVLGCVLDRMDKAGVSYPSMTTIAEDARISRSQVVRVIPRLQNLGYLQFDSGNQANSNRYRIGSKGGCTQAPTPRRTDEPTPRSMDASTPRRTHASGVGAHSYKGVGAPMSLELALKLTSSNEPDKSSVQMISSFEEFWKAYPRKQGKENAKRAFEKRKPDRSLLTQMLQALSQHSASEQWTKDGGKFIPMAVTWLNQARWTDELSAARPTNHQLPRETDAAAINEASMRRLGLIP